MIIVDSSLAATHSWHDASKVAKSEGAIAEAANNHWLPATLNYPDRCVNGTLVSFATAYLSIGPLNPKNCQILVVDLSHLSKTLGQEVDGILGMSVLKEFEIVSVDLRHHKLVLK